MRLSREFVYERLGLSRQNLRSRLVFSMLFVFVLGLGASFMLHHEEGPLPEPYQDILVLISGTIAAAAVSWLISVWSLRHVASASHEAAMVTPAEPDLRITTKQLPGEIRPLVEAVNGALDRLSSAYAMERRFVANAAHELRTPLAVLSLRLQRAKLDGNPDWQAIEQDMASLNKLVGQLLDLARKEQAGLGAKDRVPVNLSRIAREAAASVLPLAEDMEREMDVDLPHKLNVVGRADDLRDMIRNLLENALIHGRGKISLSGKMKVEPSGSKALIIVTDEGEGIPEDLREEVFERFRKLRAETQGHGLGLAIAREVARSHGGNISYSPGAASVVRVILPGRP